MSDIKKENELSKLSYSVAEASELTSLSKSFLRNQIREKKLKIKRFGRRILITADALNEYLNGASDEN